MLFMVPAAAMLHTGAFIFTISVHAPAAAAGDARGSGCDLYPAVATNQRFG